MKTNHRNSWYMIVCLLLLFGLYGCAALVAGGAAGGATYIYKEGWTERYYDAGLDRSYNAGLQAAKNLGMTVEEKSKEVASANIKAKKGDDNYWIKMEETARNRTNVSVRAGIMGNEEASRKVLEEIDRVL